jgi:hypothetical protein
VSFSSCFLHSLLNSHSNFCVRVCVCGCMCVCPQFVNFSYTFLIPHLFATSASASASREVSEDMEGFLKQATQKGFIRKTSALEPFGDFENIAVEEKDKDKDKEKMREVLSRQGSAQDVVKGIYLSSAVF